VRGAGAELVAWSETLDEDITARVNVLAQGPAVLGPGCTLYRTDAVRAVNGWPTGSGDVGIVWRLLERAWRVEREELAVAFVEGDATMGARAHAILRAAAAVRSARREPGSMRPPAAGSRWAAAVTTARAGATVALGVSLVPAVVLGVLGFPGVLVAHLVLVWPAWLAAAALAWHARREALDALRLPVAEPRGLVLASAGVELLLGPVAALRALGAALGSRRGPDALVERA
jgi:biofilm PGA synthesis N-glycosyltransferase PgaC